MALKVGVWFSPDKDSWGKRPIYVKRYDDNDYIFMVVRMHYKCSPIKNNHYHWIRAGYRVYMLGRYKGHKLYKTLKEAMAAADRLAETMQNT